MARPIIDDGEGTIDVPSPVTVQPEEKLSVIQAFQRIFDYLRAIVTAINGNLSLGSASPSVRAGNLNAQWLEVYFAAANTDTVIQHGLGRKAVEVFAGLPVDGYTTLKKVSTGSWTRDTIIIQSSTMGVTVNLLVF